MSTQDDLDRAFGEALRALRTTKGMSQESLAIAAEVDQSRLSKVERGGPSMIGWTGLRRIADALGHDIEINFRLRVPEKAKSPSGIADRASRN